MGEYDNGGRRLPVPVSGSEFEVSADVVLVAFGYDHVPFPTGSDLGQIASNAWGGIQVDEHQMTNIPGVFAGGDVVRGPSLVAHAVRDARRAAAEIHRFCFALRADEVCTTLTDHLSSEIG